jgi:hypothetical protein
MTFQDISVIQLAADACIILSLDSLHGPSQKRKYEDDGNPFPMTNSFSNLLRTISKVNEIFSFFLDVFNKNKELLKKTLFANRIVIHQSFLLSFGCYWSSMHRRFPMKTWPS